MVYTSKLEKRDKGREKYKKKKKNLNIINEPMKFFP